MSCGRRIFQDFERTCYLGQVLARLGLLSVTSNSHEERRLPDNFPNLQV
jgi:hypothetical protein